MKINRKTILFVEDNPLVLTVYRNRLQCEGFNVEAAEDGMAALEKLPQLKPSLVILDLMLPKLNGLDVLKFIRGHAGLKETPVMILSNAYMDDRTSIAMTAGANKRMLKTQCTPAKLIEAVRELLGMPPKIVPSTGDVQIDSMLKEVDDVLLNEARAGLLKDAPAEVAKIREHCLAFVKAAGSPAGLEHLNNLYQRVRFLCARAGLGDCTKIAHLASALEAILFEIIFKKSSPSASVLQTIAQAVDCLGRLFQSDGSHSTESTLKAKVLVVDDDPVCNFVTVAAMKRAKLEAVSTQDPVAALDLAQAERYDIVLLDINMPGLNGFEVCEKLRLLSDYQRTPVIFVTSNSEFQNRAQAVLSGGNDLIAKPISPLELALKTIMHLIEPREQCAEKTPTEFKTRTAVAKPAPSAAEQIELHAEDLDAADKNVGIKIKMEAPAKPVIAAEKSKIEANGGEELSPVAQRNVPPSIKITLPENIKIPAISLFTTERLPVNRINPPSNHTNTQPLMKNQNNSSQPFDKVVNEVSRIIFGDENLSEMPRRLTRIALERYNVPEIINHVPAANGSANGGKPHLTDEPFDRVTHEVTRLIFGDGEISEMHVRLTRLALERYNVPEIISHHSTEKNRLNSTNGSYISGAAII